MLTSSYISIFYIMMLLYGECFHAGLCMRVVFFELYSTGVAISLSAPAFSFVSACTFFSGSIRATFGAILLLVYLLCKP